MSKALIIKHGGITYVPDQPLGDITYTAGYTSQSNGNSSSPAVKFKGEKYSLAQLWGSGSNIEAWFVGNNHSNFLYSSDGGDSWSERTPDWAVNTQSTPSANIDYFQELRSDGKYYLRHRSAVTTDYTSLIGSYTTTATQNSSAWYQDFLKASLGNNDYGTGKIRYRDPDQTYLTVNVNIMVLPFPGGSGFVVIAAESQYGTTLYRNIFVPIQNNTCWSISPVYVGTTDGSGNSTIYFIVQMSDGKLYLYNFSLTNNSANSITTVTDNSSNEVVIPEVIKNWSFSTTRVWNCGNYGSNGFDGYWNINGSTGRATFTALSAPITGSKALYAFRSFKKLDYPVTSGSNMPNYVYCDGRYIYTPSQSSALFDMNDVGDLSHEPVNTDREFQFYNYYDSTFGDIQFICMSEQKIVYIVHPQRNLPAYTAAVPIWISDCPIIKVAQLGNSIYGIDASGRLMQFTANGGWTYGTSNSGIDTTVTSQFGYDDAYNILSSNNSSLPGLGWFFTKNKTAYWTNTNGATNSAEATSSYTITDVDVDTVSNKIVALARDSYILFNRNSAMPYHIDFNIPTTVTSADTTIKRYVQLGTTHVFAYAALNTDILEGQRYVLWTKADLASYNIFQPLSDFKFETNKITAVKDIYVWNNYVIIHGSSAVKQHVWYKVWKSTEDNTWKHREIICDMPYDEVLEPCVTNDYVVFVGKTTHKIYFTNLMNSSSYTYQLSSNDSSIIGIVETSSNNFTVFESNGSYGYLEFELAQ